MTIYDFPGGNPFNGDPVQSNRVRAVVQVIVNGIDVTASLMPFLISLRINQGASYNIEIELDDRDGRLPIPPINAPIQASIGWSTEAKQLVVNGFVAHPTSLFSREQGGRRLIITGSAVSFLAGIKSPFVMHLGEGAPPGKDQGTMHAMTDWLNQLSVASGVKVQVHSDFANVLRDYWEIHGSLQHHAQQLVDTNGGFTYHYGNSLVVTKWGERPDGSSNSFNAVWGKNLIGWKVTPFISRTIWGSASQDYFHDRLANTIKVKGNVLEGQAVWQLPHPAPNASVAQQNVNAAAANVGYGGMGRICINGEPSLRIMDTINLSGARPGVDGEWFVGDAEHLYSREGYVTWATVWPSAAAYQTWLATGALSVQSSTPASSSDGLGG